MSLVLIRKLRPGSSRDDLKGLTILLLKAGNSGMPPGTMPSFWNQRQPLKIPRDVKDGAVGREDR